MREDRPSQADPLAEQYYFLLDPENWEDRKGCCLFWSRYHGVHGYFEPATEGIMGPR